MKYAEARKEFNQMSYASDDPQRAYMYAGSHVTKAYDPYNAAENNYYRTWEIQRRSGKDQRDIPIPPPPYQTRGSDGSLTSDPRFRHVDHIYESPKFERRDFNPEENIVQGEFTPGTQYFELDPDVMGNRPGEPSTSSARNNAQFVDPRNYPAPPNRLQ